jgi:hypothetical protein
MHTDDRHLPDAKLLTVEVSAVDDGFAAIN